MKRTLFRIVAAAGVVALYAACNDNTTSPKMGRTPPATPSFDFTTEANGSGECMGDAAVTANSLVSNWVTGLHAATDLNCTANDISVATAHIKEFSLTSSSGPFTTLTPGDSIQCTPGQTIFARVIADLVSTATQRYNIGVWIADDSTLQTAGSAVTGHCRHYNLIPGSHGSNEANVPADACGDLSSAVPADTLDLDVLNIVCTAGQAVVTVNNCIGWQNSDQTKDRGICPDTTMGTTTVSNADAFRYGTLPENTSKCNCSPFKVPIAVRGKITIVKKTVGGDGTFGFTSDVGANSNPDVGSTFNVTTVSDSGSQLITNVKAGTYHISESTVASDFDFTSVSCTPNNGFASATTDSATKKATITMGNGGDITCTFTNTHKTFLTLVKTLTNDNGGAKVLSDFALTATGPVTISGTSGTTAVTDRLVTAGQYALTEQTQSGYTASSWTCTGGGTQSGTNITLATGDSPTCTIINNDNGPTLTLVKTISNDNGGTKTPSDFPLTASGPVTISGVSGGTAVTARTVSAGTYALTEQTQAGYTPSTWSCTGGTQSGTDITLGLGGAATCTIHNDDIGPALTLVKTITNDDGGAKTLSDFPLTAAGPVTISGVSGTSSVTGHVVSAGSYALTEQTQAGYTASSWTCSGGTQSGTNIQLDLAGHATCTINNNDNAPTLTLVKVVTNNNGGLKTLADFPLTASGPMTITGVSGTTAVTDRKVSAGSYALTEQTQAGYSASSWSCTGGTQTGTNIALGLDGSATCTIGNNDIGPTLTLVKTITNDNGGTKSASDFSLTATGPIPPDCNAGSTSGVTGNANVTNKELCAGTYTLSEQTQAGYTASSWSCNGGVQVGNTVSLGLATNATCTINNNDNPPGLTLVKVVTNDNGGTKTLSDFPLTASGPVTILGVSGTTSVTNRSVNAGSYALTEQTQSGYTASSWLCDGGTQSGSNIALTIGGSATCAITNDDIGPSLTLVKVVTNNNGGTKALSDFPLTASGPVSISGVSGTTAVTSRTVSAGSYALSEQTQAGYSAGSWACSGDGTLSGSSVTLGLNGTGTTCTITNDDIGPELTLVKVVTNDNGGTKTLSNFPLTASGPVTISGVSGTTSVTNRVVNAGSYALTEQTQAGYTSSSWSCTGGTQTGSDIALDLNGAATCTIGNNDDAASLTLVKVVTNDNGGTKTLSDFALTASGPLTISGVSGTTAVTGRAVSAGTYALSEQTQSGYTAGSWSCDGGTQSNSSITVGLGGSATCTITNDDNGPTLTLVKVVTNDNGGTKTLSDFPLTASGPVTISGVSGTTSVTSRVVNAGSYALTEQTSSTYTASSWSCAGGSQSGSNISLTLGQSATCTISNDDIPQGRGAIAPTQTTCQDFIANNYTPITTLLAQTKGNTINSISPGVFFYYATVSKATAAASVGFAETRTPTGAPLYGVQNGQAYLYDLSCNRVSTLSPTATAGQWSDGSGLPAGDYILGVKFDATTGASGTANSLPWLHNFQLLDGSSKAQVSTVKKKP